MKVPNQASARPGRVAVLPALATSLLAAVLMAACSSEAAPGAPPPPEVSVAVISAQPVRQWDAFTGRVTAVETVELRPRVRRVRRSARAPR